MRTYFKIVFCFLFAVGLMTINLPVAFSQENTDVSTPEQTAVSAPEKTEVSTQEKTDVLTREIQGEIVLVDLEKSILVIKTLTDESTNTYEDVAFSIGNYTAIEKDYEGKGLADLMVGEEAVIDYTANSDGTNIATYIGVKSREKQENNIE